MIVVLEGPDNSGKSTLAAYLSETLGIPVRHSGGPSKYPGEIHERIERYRADPGVYIYDRHPCISQGIYLSALRLSGEYPKEEAERQFYDDKHLIIYCRNRGTLDGHRVSEYTQNDYVRRVEHYFEDLCRTYDAWALRRAHITYRIGDDMALIARQVQTYLEPFKHLVEDLRRASRFDPVADIEEFHKFFHLEYNGLPRVLPDDLGEFREGFLKEEVDEYIGHSQQARKEMTPMFFNDRVDNRIIAHHLEQLLDALVDEVYVALGTSYLHGFDFRRAWKRVHEANMKKVRATSETRGKRGDAQFDIIKPKGWQPPSHADLVWPHAHIATQTKVMAGE